jgi:hypothetical protein
VGVFWGENGANLSEKIVCFVEVLRSVPLFFTFLAVRGAVIAVGVAGKFEFSIMAMCPIRL